MVSGTRVTARFPTPRVVPDVHRGFAVDAKALNQSTVNGIFALQKGAIFFLNVRENGIRLWKFLLRLFLNHLSQTVAVSVQNLCHGA